jgi:hypothetical protein
MMSQLDKIQKDYDSKKKSKGMKDAVESTEEIRRWVSKPLDGEISLFCDVFEYFMRLIFCLKFANIELGRAHLVD